MSSFRTRRFFRPSCLPRLFAKRMRKSCSAALASSAFSSSSLRLRILSSSIIGSFEIRASALALGKLLGHNLGLHIRPNDKRRLQWQFVRGEAHGLLRDIDRHALHLEEDLARANYRDPVVGSTFAFTHTGFGRLLRDRLVREQTQPNLSAALDETRHRDTRGLNLAVGNVAALQNLQTVVAKREIGAAPRLAAHAAALLLAILDLLGQKHGKTRLSNLRTENFFRVDRVKRESKKLSRGLCTSY